MQQDKRRRQVREEFGPEYHRTLARTGDRGKAQKELEERKKRVSSFDLKTLPREVAERFRYEWRRIQERFVDEPKDATTKADQLVQRVMNECGYPMAQFDRRAADISVEHAEVVRITGGPIRFRKRTSAERQARRTCAKLSFITARYSSNFWSPRGRPPNRPAVGRAVCFVQSEEVTICYAA